MRIKMVVFEQVARKPDKVLFEITRQGIDRDAVMEKLSSDLMNFLNGDKLHTEGDT